MKYSDLRTHLMETNTEPECPRCKKALEYVDYMEPTKGNPLTEGSLYHCEGCRSNWLERESDGLFVRTVAPDLLNDEE